jgi:hypothetical protein
MIEVFPNPPDVAEKLNLPLVCLASAHAKKVDAAQKNRGKCYVCGGPHFARECPNNGGGGGGGGGGWRGGGGGGDNCFTCGRPGHRE